MKKVTLKTLRVGEGFQLNTTHPIGQDVFVKVRGGARPGCGGELIRFAPTTPVKRYISCWVSA